MTNCYKSQDAIAKSFHIGIDQLYDLPFRRFQIMLINFNEMVEAENKKAGTNTNNNNGSLPNYNKIIKQGSPSLPKIGSINGFK